MRRQQRLGRREVVVGRDQHLALDRLRDARRVRHGRGEGLRRAGRRAHQRVVVAAVVAALELHDLVALAEGARGAEREERRLGARGGEADLLAAGHGAADLVGQAHDRLAHHVVGRAVRDLRADGLDHGRMRVAEDQRARAEQVVDVLAPAHVPDARAPPAPDDERQLVGEPRRAEHAARQALRGQLEQPALLGGPRAGRLAHAPPRSWCVIGRAQRAVRSGQSASAPRARTARPSVAAQRLSLPNSARQDQSRRVAKWSECS